MSKKNRKVVFWCEVEHNADVDRLCMGISAAHVAIALGRLQVPLQPSPAREARGASSDAANFTGLVLGCIEAKIFK